jgi:hypothetical protein
MNDSTIAKKIPTGHHRVQQRKVNEAKYADTGRADKIDTLAAESV